MRPQQSTLNPVPGPPPTTDSRAVQAAKIQALLERHSPRPLCELACLDIGCHGGLITAALAPLFAQTCGVEYEWVGLQHARPEAATHLSFVRGDAMKLPFADGVFDVVLCTHVYEHVPDDRLLFAEIWRVLAPGGIVFFSGPNWLYPIEPHYFQPFLHWLPQRLADRRLRKLGGPPHYYERLRTVWSLRRLLSNYRIVDVTPETAELRLPDQRLRRLAAAIPRAAWGLVTPLLPSFNWILLKPESA